MSDQINRSFFIRQVDSFVLFSSLSESALLDLHGYPPFNVFVCSTGTAK
jgi:hypothetical protein